MTGSTLTRRTVKQRLANWGLTSVSLLALSTTALAHHLPPGYEDVDEFDQAQMISGLLHPFTGLDHLLLALAMGWVAYMAGKRMGMILSSAFFGSLALGMTLGRMGLGVPMLEQGIALSVIAGGVLLAYAARQMKYSSLVFAVLAGLWHGNAHGAEIPSAASALAFGAALMAGTAAIAGAGVGLAALCSYREEPMGRWIGACITAVGAWLYLA